MPLKDLNLKSIHSFYGKAQHERRVEFAHLHQTDFYALSNVYGPIWKWDVEESSTLRCHPFDATVSPSPTAICSEPFHLCLRCKTGSDRLQLFTNALGNKSRISRVSFPFCFSKQYIRMRAKWQYQNVNLKECHVL